jgi:hypothetical protein
MRAAPTKGWMLPNEHVIRHAATNMEFEATEMMQRAMTSLNQYSG